MSYNPALDGVRGLAILAVVAFHCGVPGSGGGYLGVDVFFVLSGYLITSLLMAEHRGGGIRIGSFYIRRALRLYPTLLLLVAAYLLMAPALWPADQPWLNAAFASFYAMDYAMAFRYASKTIGHTWSLGVEEKFYLLWPLLLPLTLRTRRPIAWLLAAFACFSAWRCFVTIFWGWAQAYFSFDTRMSGILIGAIAAVTPLQVSRQAALIAGGALVFCIACPWMPSLPAQLAVEAVTLEVTLAELSAFLIIGYLAEHRHCPILASPAMAYIGRLSYGVYLWHFPLVVLLRDSYFAPWWMAVPAALVFSSVLAPICLHMVATPIKRWRVERPLARGAVIT